jgi:V/A-type H+-transporting ATPase subunit I
MLFRSAPMKHITLHLIREDAETAATALAQTGVFSPEVPAAAGEFPEFPAERYRRIFDGAMIRLAKIRQWIECEPEPLEEMPPPITLAELEESDRLLHELWSQLSAYEEQMRSLNEKNRYLEQLASSLDRFASLDIDLGMLQAETSFIKVHVGVVPEQNLRQLGRALTLSGHIMEDFHVAGDEVYVIVAGPTEGEGELQGLLRSADFRPVQLPAEFRDRPERIREQLKNECKIVTSSTAQIEAKIRAMGDENRPALKKACKRIFLARPFASLAGDLRGQGGLVTVEGWAPADRLPVIDELLRNRLSHPYLLSARDPGPEEYPSVPSLIRHRWPLRPFAALVGNYGLPRYGEIDPTLLFAVSFVIMFGMMFGDVGHGAVIASGALFVRKRFPTIVPFFLGAGFSSIVFGFLYGSIFGFEHVLHALWVAPMSDPIYLLKVALWWGVGFIVVANLLSIRNQLVSGHPWDALLDSRGVAGLLLFAGGYYAISRWMSTGEFGIVQTLVILVPLAAIAARKWVELDNPTGERVIVVAIESFESVMNYLANALSFLRVAAFSLNHVALAIAVFTIAESMHTTGYWVTVVLGNIFIIVLEGAIVTIQCLRLEYYEGFSRFYSGDGRTFEPLRFES